MPVLFISDLHLHADRPDLIRAIVRYLGDRARQAHSLYILGDLFEAWIGDDAPTEADRQVIDALATLSRRGTRLYFQHGNRDFLLGEGFAQATGATLLPERHCIELGGERVLLMHGDSLCLEDRAYQQFRAQVRSPEWQAEFLSQPVETRRQIARDLRAGSQSANQAKGEEILDVSPEEVCRQMRKAGVRTLIHGHTHRPAVHDFTLDGEPARRIVLGDWDRRAWQLRWSARQGFELEKLPLL